MNLATVQDKCAPFLLSLLRFVAALIMLEHGTQKVLGFPPIVANVPYSTLGYVAGWIEIIGGVALIIGLFSRPIAFIFAGEMAVAYFLRHFPRGFYPVNNGGDLAVILCFVFLFISAAGPGTWSFDTLWWARNKRSSDGAVTRGTHLP